MNKSKRIYHDGEYRTLKEWADIYGIPYSTVQYRYASGCRSFESLFRGLNKMPIRLREKDIEWLKETRPARKGTKNEWKIACELLGISKHRADELRELVEGLI